jgi:hypothetical protein
MDPASTRLQRRDAFAACAGFPIDSLEAALIRAHEIAIGDKLDAVASCIDEARVYLRRLRLLHQEALDEFNEAQGE